MPDGSITTFVAPGADATYAYRINDNGDVVGTASIPNVATEGFVRDVQSRPNPAEQGWPVREEFS
jgi:hypothetical protein